MMRHTRLLAPKPKATEYDHVEPAIAELVGRCERERGAIIVSYPEHPKQHKRTGGKPRSTTPKQEARIHTLRAWGWSYQRIADELGIRWGVVEYAVRHPR